jgi:hypothetical protein
MKLKLSLRARMSSATVLGFISLLFWAISSPIGSSPDDDFHLASIWCEGIKGSEFCTVAQDNSSAAVPIALVKGHQCFATNGYQSAACQKEVLNSSKSNLVETSHGNWNNLYPSGFYKVMSTMADSNFVKSVITMRLFNAVLFLLIMCLVYRAVEYRIFLHYTVALLAGLIGLGYFLIPSTNPSSWAIVACATFAITFGSYFMGHIKSKFFLFLCIYLSLFMAISSRADATAYIAITAGIVLIFSNLKKLTPMHFLVFASVLLIAFVRLVNGPGQTNALINGGVGVENLTRPENVTLWINLQNLPSLLIGSFGYWGLGWFDTAIPIAGWLTTTVVVSLLIWSHIPFLDLRTQLRALVAFVILCLIPLWIMSRGNNVVGEAVQPRYIYPFMLAVLALTISSSPTNTLMSKAQKNILIFMMGMAHSIVFHAELRRYVTGQDISGINLNLNLEWWWDIFISPNLVWILCSLSFTATVTLMIYARDELRTSNNYP